MHPTVLLLRTVQKHYWTPSLSATMLWDLQLIRILHLKNIWASKNNCVLRSLHTESKLFVCVFFFWMRKMHLKRCTEWKMKVSDALCKHDWHNVIFYVQQEIQTPCARTFTHTQNETHLKNRSTCVVILSVRVIQKPILIFITVLLTIWHTNQTKHFNQMT